MVPPGPDDDVPAYDDLLLLHLESSLYTGNARPTQDAILAAALAAHPTAVVLEGAQVGRVTTPFLEVVEGLAADLAEEGIGLLLAGFPDSTIEAARQSHWFENLDESGRICHTVDEAVELARAR